MLKLFTFLPIAGGLILPLLSKKNEKISGRLALIFSLLTSLLGLYVIIMPEMRETLIYLGRHLPIVLKSDGLSKLFLSILCLLWPLSCLYACYYMKHEEKPTSFFSFFTICYGVCLQLALSSNILSLFFFYELLTLASLPIIMHGGSSKRVKAGLSYMYYSLGGSALAFIGLMYLLSLKSTPEDFLLGGLFEGVGESRQLHIAYILFFLGFSVKAAVFPMHAWLPKASVAPTPVTALLHAVAVVKSGVFAMMRITFFVIGAKQIRGSLAQTMPFIMAAFTIVFASIKALNEGNLKKRLAYSTIANLSYIIIGITLLSEQGFYASMQHMLYHAIMKIGIFMVSGALLIQGIKYCAELQGVAKKMPISALCFLLSGLAVCALPPFIGFQSKLSLINACIGANSALGYIGIAVLLFSSVASIIYLGTPCIRMYFGKPEEKTLQLSENNAVLLICLVLLTAMGLALMLMQGDAYALLNGISHMGGVK